MKLPISSARGASLVEYSLLAGLVSIVTLVSVAALGGGVSKSFDTTNTELAKANTSIPPSETGGGGAAAPDGAPSAPADPYVGYYDPDTFLIGTSGPDTLDISFTSHPGIMALEDNDRLDAGSSGGILIGHKGNDTIYTSTGDDTIVFAAGDGQDFIRTGSGNDKLIFPNLNASDATFHASGPDMDISWASGDKVTIDEIFWDRSYGFELFKFADREFTFEQAIARAQDDDKSVGTVRTSRGNDAIVHRASIDPGYTITGYTDGTDSLTFEETNFADVTFIRNSQSHMTVRDGGDVFIQDYLWTRGWIENFVFKDGPRTTDEIWQRSLEDSQSTGTVQMSRHDDYFTHTNGAGDYTVTGSYSGIDELVFVNEASTDATFSQSSSHLVITTSAGDKVTISSYLSSSASVRGWLETIRFTDGALTADQFQARIDSGG